ncbi:MAG TPA: hypothetical protein VFU06_14880 [Longimicrobiales bacterium]|nr:hypothetical protein [Longimicrobiales bacterium]
MVTRHVVRVILLLAGGTMPASAQFSALPGVVHLGAEGDADVAVVQVRNEGDRPLQLRVYLSDYDQAEDGSYVFHEPGTASGSCLGRISFFPDNTLLEPGQRQEIRVRVEAGAGACWSLLFIESAPEGAGQVRVANRIGVRVLNAPGSLTREGGLAEVTATQADSLHVSMLFRNTGTAPVEVHGTLEIRDVAGSTVATAHVGPLGVLPGHARRFGSVLPPLPPGDYLAVPVLEFGADWLAGGQALFTVH